MDTKNYIKIFVLSILVAISTAEPEEKVSDLMLDIENAESQAKVLSRRKRFLTFPEGSSFQLVFCTQNHGYLHVGDIVWFGNTAALAWELPTDPTFFHILKSYEKKYDAQRKQDSKHVIFLDENGKVVKTKPYHRKPIVNPAFAKRSVADQKIAMKEAFSIKDMHEAGMNRSYFDDLDDGSIEFHREGRESLYVKLETFFEGIGWHGKDCVRRLLCESGETKDKQGTFMEEILKATFTVPRSRGSELKEYDLDHKSGDCAKLCSRCESSENPNV